MPALDGGDEGQEFVEVALRMNLVVGERRDEVVAAAEVFDGLSARPHLLNGNAGDGGWSWFKGKFFHLREAVDAL